MNPRFLVRAMVIAAACLVSCAPLRAQAQGDANAVPFKEVSIGASAFSLGDPVPAWAELVAIPEGGKGQPVVVRLADTQFQVADTQAIFVRRALTVNDASSLTDAGQIPIGFVPQYQRLQLHAVRVHRGAEVLDRTKSSPVRFLQREMGLEQGLYSGLVTASILVSDLRVGDTLEYVYSLHGRNPVFGGKFIEWSGWDQAHPILLRRVALNHPAARKIAWRMLGDGQAKQVVPRESSSGAQRKLQFEETALAPVVADPFVPAEYLPYRMLQFSEFASLDEVVAWANGLFRVEGALDDELRAVVARLRQKPSVEERVAAALEFVQSEIRYFSVSLGESSHRPTQPAVVMKQRYGDCKDKSLLLMALLKELGVRGSPVLLSLGVRKGLDRMLPSPQAFDHVIVQATVGDKTYYLDPTRIAQYGRLDRMGQAHEGAQGLLVDPATRQFVTIASANAVDLFRTELVETASVAKFTADGQLRARETWTGVYAESLRALRERVPADQFQRIFSETVETRYPGARLEGQPEIQDDRVNTVFSVTTNYTVPKLVNERDGAWFVRFTPSNMKGTLAAPPSIKRSSPLGVPRFPFEAKYSFEMRFPEEVSVISDPRSESTDNRYFAQRVTSSFRGNVAKAAIDLRTLGDRVEVNDLPRYVEDLRLANAAIRGVVAVGKGAIKSAGKAQKKDLAQTVQERVEDVVEKTSAAIKSGKLTGSDLASAHCSRADAYAHLGRTDEALRDANQAMKIAPNSTEVLTCRALVYFKGGQFDSSVADYSKAVILGSTDPRTFHMRGIANYYAGRMDEAASDFAKAADTPDREAQVYADLWQVWAHQRLGKPVPEAVAKRASAQPRGDWPRPALATALGTLTPEEMIRLVESKGGDERQMALAEGYFYLGQHYLGRGDKRKAQELFERTRQQGVIIYNEHAAAEIELRRLGDLPPTAPLPAARATPAAAPARSAPPAPRPVMQDRPQSEDTRSSN